MIATSSGMAEFYAGCATAEEMLFCIEFADVFWIPGRGGASLGQRGIPRGLQT